MAYGSRLMCTPILAAQYGRGSTPEDDMLTVYAEAFERDADPDDFALEAIDRSKPIPSD
jgi:hypothetical protein